jgi:hypothetical protein
VEESSGTPATTNNNRRSPQAKYAAVRAPLASFFVRRRMTLPKVGRHLLHSRRICRLELIFKML